jgi:predicted ATP-binding protein involved in virulence
VARVLTNGAGKSAVLVFIQQVLRANKAVHC